MYYDNYVLKANPYILTFVRFLLPPHVIVVGYLHGHILRILSRQLQLDRRRVQYLYVRKVYGQVGRAFRFDLVIAQGNVAESDRATRVSKIQDNESWQSERTCKTIV